MKIIIFGAGQVGSTVANSLVREDNEVTVVDINQFRLKELQNRMDIRGVHGFGSHPRTLARAGTNDADLIVALTDSDEANMAICQVAYTLFKTPTKIARIRSSDYLEHPELFEGSACPIDVLISPEQLVTHYIKRLIEYPGSLQVVDFANEKVNLVGIKVPYSSDYCNMPVSFFAESLPKDIEARIVALFRHNRAIIPQGNTVIQADDDMFFLAAKKDTKTIISQVIEAIKPARRIILAGGGNIGKSLASSLEKQHYVKVIERDINQARLITEELDKAIVLVGDCSDSALLSEENIDQTDIYCSLTNDDEANILSAMLAKSMGAAKAMCLINKVSYVTLAERGNVDVAISPQQITIGALLTHVRRGHVVQVHTLRGGAVEAMETVAHGDQNSSKVVGRTIEEIKLPVGTTIAALVRDGKLIIAHHDTRVESDDHVILFLTDRSQVGEVEELFQVDVTFL